MEFAKLRNEMLRENRENAHLNFLLLCKDFKVTPNHLKIINKTLVSSFPDKVYRFQCEVLNFAIRSKRAYIRNISKKVLAAKDVFKGKLGERELKFAITRINKFCHGQQFRLNLTHQKKVGNLLRAQSNSKNELYIIPKPVAFLNLSNRIFNSQENALFEKGPKYIFQPRPNIKEIVPQVEEIISKIPWQHREQTRALIALKVDKYIKKERNHDTEDLKCISKLKNDKDLTVTMSDKSNKIVILNRSDYDNKMMEAIVSMKCLEVKKNPINKILTKMKNLIKTGAWPNNIKPNIPLMVDIPIIMGRIKDHKINMPIRPIVAKYNAPTYFLEKIMAKILNEYLPTSNRIVASTVDFVDKIKNLGVKKGEILASLDVEKLYPSINLNIAEERICACIENQNDISNENKTTLKSAIALVLRNNFFKFNNKFYHQAEGAPMGSPISGTLAEFILRPLEDNIFQNITPQPRVWFRFVDDVFITWDGSHNLSNFVEQINNIEKEINFTMETEIDNTLNFLDLSISHKNGRITRDVYRKPMATGSIIPSKANTPFRYKQAAFRFLINRAYKCCSKKNRNKEIQRIYDIAKDHGYGPKIVSDVIRNLKNNLHRPKPPGDRIKIAGSMGYYGGLTESIAKVFKKHEINVAIKTTFKMNRLINNTKPKTENENKNGVYVIPYKEENGNEKVYLGMTKRKLKIRKKEHEKDIKFAKKTTALARVNHKENIDIHFDKTKVIAPFSTIFGTTMRESIEIMLAGKNACNENNSLDIPKIWKPIIYRHNRHKFKKFIDTSIDGDTTHRDAGIQEQAATSMEATTAS